MTMTLPEFMTYFMTAFVVLWFFVHWLIDGAPFHKHEWETTYTDSCFRDYQRCTVCGNQRSVHCGNVRGW